MLTNELTTVNDAADMTKSASAPQPRNHAKQMDFEAERKNSEHEMAGKKRDDDFH